MIGCQMTMDVFGYAKADTLVSHSQNLQAEDFGGMTYKLVDRGYKETNLK